MSFGRTIKSAGSGREKRGGEPRVYRAIYLLFFLLLPISLAKEPRTIGWLVVFSTLAMVIYSGGTLVLAKLFGARIESVGLFYGLPVARTRIGQTDFQLGFVPLGSFVKFPAAPTGGPLTPAIEPLEYLHPLQRISLMLSGPAVSFLTGIVLVGPTPAIIAIKAFCHSLARDLPHVHLALTLSWNGYLSDLHAAPTASDFGLVTLWMGLLNMVPVPICAGGMALIEFIRWCFGKRLARYTTRFLLYPGLPLTIWFLVENIRAICAAAFARN